MIDQLMSADVLSSGLCLRKNWVIVGNEMIKCGMGRDKNGEVRI